MLRKKIIYFILIFTVFLCRINMVSYALSASSAVVMIAQTGEVVFNENADKKMSMASTTKIMTALLAVESGRLDEVVTITDEMVRVEGTSLGLRQGNKLTLYNLVKGMMLLSGNDAANACAIFLSGSLMAFAEQMNKKAEEIGMKNTHFVTPSGLDDEEHYSTAYDMALLASYAMKNDVFRSCVCDCRGNVDYISPEMSCVYRNHNRFLTMYDGACGVKTGFTKKSGRCLVSAVEKDDCMLIAVTLNAPDDWNDHLSLYNECFPKIRNAVDGDDFNCVLDVSGGEKTSVNASLSGEIKVHTANNKTTTLLLTEKLLYAPVEEGDIVGSLRVFIGDKAVGDYPVVAQESIKQNTNALSEKGFIDKIKDLFRRFERWLITAL